MNLPFASALSQDGGPRRFNFSIVRIVKKHEHDILNMDIL
jgi:hypothetical protein